jgi:hypothetical protein
MMRRLCLVVFGFICLFVLISIAKHEGHASSATTWEYKIFNISPPSTNEQAEQKLSQLGAQGWELVQLNPGEGSGGGVYYLKRAK